MHRRIDDAGLGFLQEKVQNQERFTREDGMTLYACSDVAAIGMLANMVRERLYGDRTFFVRNRHLNPTNVCEADCLFCAFKSDPVSIVLYQSGF